MMMIRQGDVLLVRREAPEESRRRTDVLGLRVPGERTGHAHVLPAEVHETPAGDTMLYVDEPTALTHEEHAPIEVPAGWWEPRMQREFVPSFSPQARAQFD